MQQQWMKLAVDYWQDPKWKGLGATHEAFYVRLLGYTRKWNTGGFIPADAIALCGRRIYNRDKVLADLVDAGLLTTEDQGYAFPKAWRKYSARHDGSSHQSAGQGGRSCAGGEEKRRYIPIPIEDQLAPANEVKDPRLSALLDRIGKQVESKINGSGS